VEIDGENRVGGGWGGVISYGRSGKSKGDYTNVYYLG